MDTAKGFARRKLCSAFASLPLLFAAASAGAWDIRDLTDPYVSGITIGNEAQYWVQTGAGKNRGTLVESLSLSDNGLKLKAALPIVLVDNSGEVPRIGGDPYPEIEGSIRLLNTGVVTFGAGVGFEVPFGETEMAGAFKLPLSTRLNTRWLIADLKLTATNALSSTVVYSEGGFSQTVELNPGWGYTLEGWFGTPVTSRLLLGGGFFRLQGGRIELKSQNGSTESRPGMKMSFLGPAVQVMLDDEILLTSFYMRATGTYDGEGPNVVTSTSLSFLF